MLFQHVFCSIDFRRFLHCLHCLRQLPQSQPASDGLSQLIDAPKCQGLRIIAVVPDELRGSSRLAKQANRLRRSRSIYARPTSPPRATTVGNAAKLCRLLQHFAGIGGPLTLRPPSPTPSKPHRITTSPDTPRELRKMQRLPDYIISRPDILSIDAVTLVPHPPYRLHPLDIVRVSASNLPPAIH